MSQFRVMLCSDSPVYANSLKVAFQESHLFRVMDDVPFEEIIDAASRLQPDVAVLKIEDEACIPVVKQLLIKCPLLLPIAIVEDPGRYDVNELLGIGLRGLLPMRLLPRQIVNAVELVAVAGILCLPRMNPGQLNKNNSQNGSNCGLNLLTTREREILGLLSKSLSNQEMQSPVHIGIDCQNPPTQYIPQIAGTQPFRSHVNALQFRLQRLYIISASQLIHHGRNGILSTVNKGTIRR